MAKHAMFPAPVYVATFEDGTIGRASFWTEQGKPFDFAHGRAVAAAIYARPDGAPDCIVGGMSARVTLYDYRHRKRSGGVYLTSTPVNRKCWDIRWPVYPPRVVVDGYVEHPSLGTHLESIDSAFKRQSFALRSLPNAVRDPAFVPKDPNVVDLDLERTKRLSWKKLAQELLAALEMALPDLEALAVPKGWPSLDARIAQCREAIAKAKQAA